VLKFFWDCPRTATALVDKDAWEQVKYLLPWPVKVVKDTPARYAVVVARADGPYFFSWLYHTAKASLRNWTAVFRARLIMTLAVWALAYVPDGEIPSWYHVGKKG
jgi:hypothetical protein